MHMTAYQKKARIEKDHGQSTKKSDRSWSATMFRYRPLPALFSIKYTQCINMKLELFFPLLKRLKESRVVLENRS